MNSIKTLINPLMKVAKNTCLAAACLLTTLNAQAGNHTGRIVSVSSDTHSTLSVRFYFEGVEKDLCGPGTRGWAYVNEDDGKWGEYYPILLSAFIANKPVTLYTVPRFVNGSETAEFCQAIVVKVKHQA